MGGKQEEKLKASGKTPMLEPDAEMPPGGPPASWASPAEGEVVSPESLGGSRHSFSRPTQASVSPSGTVEKGSGYNYAHLLTSILRE